MLFIQLSLAILGILTVSFPGVAATVNDCVATDRFYKVQTMVNTYGTTDKTFTFTSAVGAVDYSQPDLFNPPPSSQDLEDLYFLFIDKLNPSPVTDYNWIYNERANFVPRRFDTYTWTVCAGCTTEFYRVGGTCGSWDVYVADITHSTYDRNGKYVDDQSTK